MLRRRFQRDLYGRVPFALLAVLVLLMSCALAGAIGRLSDPSRGGPRPVTSEDLAVLGALEGRIMDHVVRLASETVKGGLANGTSHVGMVRELNDRIDVVVPGILDRPPGWTVMFSGLRVGIDMGSLPEGMVIGEINWSAISPDGTNYKRTTRISSVLDGPYAIAYDIVGHLVTSGDQSGELARLVRSMLQRLAFVRALSGELDPGRIVTRKDIDLALNISIGLSTGRGSHLPQNVTANGHGLVVPGSPSDMLLEAVGITKVRGSAILAQFVVGLVDYYLLWFDDYSGIGEGVEAFFEWLGERFEDDGLAEERARWWEGFKVHYQVERWAYCLMAALLHVALEMTGGDEVDVRGLGTEGISARLQVAVNRSALLLENRTLALPEEAPPSDLLQAMASFPSRDDVNTSGMVERLGLGIRTAALGALKGLLASGRDQAVRALGESADTDEVYWDPTARPSGSHGMLEDEGRLGLGDVDVVRTNVSAVSSIYVTGVHDTAPEERIRRTLSAAIEGNATEFLEVRPYETDVHISISGEYLVENLLFTSKGGPGLLVTVSDVGVRCRVPLDMSFVLPVMTGTPLWGVDYGPSDTLGGDLKEVLWEFVNTTWSGLRWAVGAVTGAVDQVVDGVRELGRRGVENLGRMSAADLSRFVEGVLRSMNARAWSSAVNLSWQFLRRLIGEDLREMLTFNVTVLGLELTVQLDVFEELLTVSHDGDGRGFVLSVKRLAEENPPFRPAPVEGYRYAVLGSGYLNRSGLAIVAGLDPLTIFQPSILQVIGEERDSEGEGFRFELSAPVAENSFKTLEVSISSVTGSPIRGVPVPGTGITVDIDAGIRARYGQDLRSPEKLLVKALRSAWYETLEGYSVKELGEDLGDPVLLEAFLVHLLHNLANSVGDIASDELPEIEVFVEGKASAAMGTAGAGFGLSFVVREPVLVLWELAKWSVDGLRAFLEGLADPGLPATAVMPPSMLLERLYIRGTATQDVGLPELLGGAKAGRASMAERVEANVPALAALAGIENGRWMVRAGVVMLGLRSALAEMIPGFDAPGTRCDLWLLQVSVMELDDNAVRLGEVYYDTAGYDARTEFVELWNPSERRVDISRWVLEDRGGLWRLPDHLSVGPGARLVVARNRDGFMDGFDELPDVAGLTLNLNNDGDALVLYDPWGVRIDAVAWEGGLSVWDLECEEGQSLQRGPVDTDTPRDWYCAEPTPGFR